jgi:mono/diheme cytochrome c family protein
MVRHKGLWMASCAVAALVLFGCSSRLDASPITASKDTDTIPSDYKGKTIPANVDASAGANLFQTDCTACHGEHGLGDGPASLSLNPPPANLVKLSQNSADDFLFWKISTGVEATAMPAWKGVLTDGQIWQVIAFIRTLK